MKFWRRQVEQSLPFDALAESFEHAHLGRLGTRVYAKFHLHCVPQSGVGVLALPFRGLVVDVVAELGRRLYVKEPRLEQGGSEGEACGDVQRRRGGLQGRRDGRDD